jgi:hypothetical protein
MAGTFHWNETRELFKPVCSDVTDRGFIRIVHEGRTDHPVNPQP